MELCRRRHKLHKVGNVLSALPKSAHPGAKKALAVAQLGLPAVAFEGIEAWHTKGTTALLDDFTLISLKDRLVELVPDGDVQTNSAVAHGITKLAGALEARGARVRVVMLPASLEAV